MKKLYLLGYPLRFSLSPKIFEIWCNLYKMEYQYLLLPQTSEELEEFFKSLNEKTDIIGFNVTMPYKKRVFEFCNYLSEEAKLVGNVNTVKITDKIEGYNTDYYALNKVIPNMNNGNVLIIGAGNYAKTSATVLRKKEFQNIYVLNRTNENIAKLGNDIIKFNGELQNLDLIINAVPEENEYYQYIINEAGSLNKECLLIDAAYNKNLTGWETTFKNIIPGKELLIYQAAKAFEIWFGKYPDVDKIIKNSNLLK